MWGKLIIYMEESKSITIPFAEEPCIQNEGAVLGNCCIPRNF